MALTIRYIPIADDPITPGLVRELKNKSGVGSVNANYRRGASAGAGAYTLTGLSAGI